MAPIVDGLEKAFEGQISFERRDAETRIGQASLRSYGLRGHPSYVIVDIEGTKLWSGMGSMPREMLQRQIEQVLMGE